MGPYEGVQIKWFSIDLETTQKENIPGKTKAYSKELLNKKEHLGVFDRLKDRRRENIPDKIEAYMLNKSNSHCYLRYRKHDPTTNINTLNATALLILDNTIDTKYDIHRLIYH